MGGDSSLATERTPNLNYCSAFATDSTGAITEWYVQVPTYDAPSSSSDPYNDWDYILLRMSNDPNSLPVPYDESLLFSAVLGDYGRTKDYRALSYDQPGVWTMGVAPEALRVPEPGTLALLPRHCPRGTRIQ